MTPPEWVELLLVHIQTKVAMVMKCRSEMLASKLFWMYLQRTVLYEELGLWAQMIWVCTSNRIRHLVRLPKERQA